MNSAGRLGIGLGLSLPFCVAMWPIVIAITLCGIVIALPIIIISMIFVACVTGYCMISTGRKSVVLSMYIMLFSCMVPALPAGSLVISVMGYEYMTGCHIVGLDRIGGITVGSVIGVYLLYLLIIALIYSAISIVAIIAGVDE